MPFCCTRFPHFSRNLNIPRLRNLSGFSVRNFSTWSLTSTKSLKNRNELSERPDILVPRYLASNIKLPLLLIFHQIFHISNIIDSPADYKLLAEIPKVRNFPKFLPICLSRHSQHGNFDRFCYTQPRCILHMQKLAYLANWEAYL